jgi:hypothetical protein
VNRNVRRENSVSSAREAASGRVTQPLVNGVVRAGCFVLFHMWCLRRVDSGRWPAAWPVPGRTGRSYA